MSLCKKMLFNLKLNSIVVTVFHGSYVYWHDEINSRRYPSEYAALIGWGQYKLILHSAIFCYYLGHFQNKNKSLFDIYRFPCSSQERERVAILNHVH